MSVDALRSRLASLGAAGAGIRREPLAYDRPRRLPPRGFEPVENAFGVAWRWAEVLPVGRLRRAEATHELGGLGIDDFCFLDTETTGLSGGTGTHVFCAAVARPHPGGIELVQHFLAEPSDEPAFLAALDAELAASPGTATYNGLSFDMPLLRTRWLMARMPGELREGRHVDLLHLSRGLLRPRFESCTLRSVEERLLGFERECDIPGHLIPQAYFDYVRTGASRDLESTLEHNRQDVLSLQHLLHRLMHRLRGRDASMDAADWLALGRYLLRRRRRSAAWRAIRTAAAGGNPDALLLLARRKAVVLEWRLRQPEAALRVVDEAIDSIGLEPDLVKRRLRLRRRLQGRPAASRAAAT
ncbi:MAG: ribonuclease H-like domain-containing protein [Candidatus Dormibacteraeota bacterium]|nr:ribonuclease H-like domain-containing protein [Candidatus Dormibacteraeota bacterium]